MELRIKKSAVIFLLMFLIGFGYIFLRNSDAPTEEQAVPDKHKQQGKLIFNCFIRKPLLN